MGLNAHLLSLDETYRAAGGSRYIYKLLQHLPAADPSLDYHAFLADGRVALARWAAHLSRWPTQRPAVRILWEQLAQPWEARRRGLHLLHAPFCVGPLAARCPLVVSVHDLSFFRYPELFRPMNRHYLQPFTRMSTRRARLVLASSESTRRDVLEILGVPPNRVSVVPLGVDDTLQPVADPDVLAAFRRRRNLPERMILYLGTLEPRKNLPTLLTAYAHLAGRAGFRHTLVVAGGRGWYYDEIDAVAERLGLRDRVLFPGYVPDDELALWYSVADLFVYPSRYEGFGLPPLEAMACGTPVVTSDASSLPEVVGDAGLTVPAEDAAALAEAMERLLEDAELRAALRERGLARARAYSWQRVARETARAYHRVLGEQ
ncbi:MAG: glycosyltransferase family 4 protein [Chloroflexi bacterium]|nr:glycosyltransferase family 4 protein [Chloroflexota bacterium]